MKVTSFNAKDSNGELIITVNYNASNPEDIFNYRGFASIQDLLEDELITVEDPICTSDGCQLVIRSRAKYDKSILDRMSEMSIQEFIITLTDSIYNLTDSVNILCENCNTTLSYSDKFCFSCRNELNDRTYTEQELTTKFDKDSREITPRQVFIILNGLRKREISGVANLEETFVNVRRCMRNLPYIEIEGTTIKLNNLSFNISKDEPATSALEGLSKIGYEFM